MQRVTSHTNQALAISFSQQNAALSLPSAAGTPSRISSLKKLFLSIYVSEAKATPQMQEVTLHTTQALAIASDCTYNTHALSFYESSLEGTP